MKKKILLILLAIILIIQFIRPAKNKSNVLSANDISNHHPVPDSVMQILRTACNDCHTNNTIYPWYTNIQPVGWWLQYHVNDGKKHLNFSEFASYTPKRQHHKMEEVIEMVKEGEMPLNSYTWMHENAKLTPEQRTILVNWSTAIMEKIAATHDIKK